jgi:hypothetical protein
MKIKLNQSLYRNILISFWILFIILGSFAYFLGFEINARSVLFYLLFAVSCAFVLLIIYFVIDASNKNFLIFDKEKIVEYRNSCEKTLVYFNQILYTKYHNEIDIIGGHIDFGYVEIVYKLDSKDKECKYINLYLSKKIYKKIFKK